MGDLSRDLGTWKKEDAGLVVWNGNREAVCKGCVTESEWKIADQGDVFCVVEENWYLKEKELVLFCERCKRRI